MPSEWTVDTLKELMLALFAERDKQISLALAAADTAVQKAETATEKRFEGVNEFRAALSDQTKNFASAEVVANLTERLDKMEGRSSGLNAGWGYLIGAVGLIVAFITIGAFVLNAMSQVPA